MTETPRAVLVVEDEMIIAMDLKMELEDHGWTVSGPAGSVDQARAAIADALTTLAVLDVNLGGETSFGLARDLIARGVKVVFLTGDSISTIPADLRGCQVLKKPFTPLELSGVLTRISAADAGAAE